MYSDEAWPSAMPFVPVTIDVTIASEMMVVGGIGSRLEVSGDGASLVVEVYGDGVGSCPCVDFGSFAVRN